MMRKDKYVEVLKKFEQPVCISTWVNEIVEEYPSILEQINSKTNEQMTLKSLAQSMSLKISKGEFSDIKVLDAEPRRLVMYISESKKNALIKKELHKDVESVIIEEKIIDDTRKLTEIERYRLAELNSIVTQLNKYFSLNFVLHHLKSLANAKDQGKHHVDNLELLTVEHSLIKKDAEKKFSIDEQKAYIKRIISIHMMVKKSIDIGLTDDVLEMLLDRLGKIY